jgi:phosphate uptake regulator
MMTEQPHIAQTFDREMDSLMATLVTMSRLVEAALTDSAAALERLDTTAAERLIAPMPPSTRWMNRST